MPFSLPNLPFDPGALEPFIDAETMRIHHGKHHATYVSKLNDSIKGTDKDRLSLEDLIGHHHSTAAIRNNGGGHWNHSLFWTLLDPERRAYDGEFGEALDQSFGGFDGFKASFSKEALARFGSGWVWLVKGADGALSVCSTPNQDNPPHGGLTGIRVQARAGPGCLGARVLP